MMNQFYLLAFCLAAACSTGSAQLQCYVCASNALEGCNTGNIDASYLLTCPGDMNSHCQTATTRSDALGTFTVRNCAGTTQNPASGCTGIAGNEVCVSYCDTNGCNDGDVGSGADSPGGSSRIVVSLSLLLFTLTAALLTYKM